MDLRAWWDEERELRKWTRGRRIALKEGHRKLELARLSGGPGAIGQAHSELEWEMQRVREAQYEIKCRRLIRQAEQLHLMVPIKGGPGWYKPEMTGEALMPDIFDQLRQAVRREQRGLDLALRVAPIIISVGSLVVAILAFLKA